MTRSVANTSPPNLSRGEPRLATVSAELPTVRPALFLRHDGSAVHYQHAVLSVECCQLVGAYAPPAHCDSAAGNAIPFDRPSGGRSGGGDRNGSWRRDCRAWRHADY